MNDEEFESIIVKNESIGKSMDEELLYEKNLKIVFDEAIQKTDERESTNFRTNKI